MRLAAVAGVVLISFSAIWVRLSGVSPDTSALFRCLYALPLLALLGRLLRDRPPPQRVRTLALLSGLLLGLDLAFWHRSIHWIGAGLATVLGNTQVVLVGLGAWLLHGERPRREVLLTLPAVLSGIVLVSGLGRHDAYGTDPLRGTLFGVLTALTYAAFLLAFRYAAAGQRLPVDALFHATLGAAAACCAVGLLSGELDLAFSWPAHGWLMALAVGSQVIGWLLIANALPRLPALETSLLLLLQPVGAVLWGLLVFGERLSAVQWSGVGIVLTGLAWLTVGAARRRRSMGSI